MAIDNIFTIASAKETAENIYKTLMKNYNGVIHIASQHQFQDMRLLRL